MRRHRFIVVPVLAALLLNGCAGAVVAAQPTTAPATPTPSASSPSQDAALAALQGTLERVYAQVNPSVVNIRVVQKEQVFFPFFPEIPGLPLPQGPQEFYRRGLGSGFVWDQEGHIVTNNHVVEGADRISVTFYDGTTVEGKVVGTDPDSDLAVVKVEPPAGGLRPVCVADSTRVQPGQLAIAIGNPFGLSGTMTVGIVSAVGRLLPVETGSAGGATYTIPDVIQTDAPINPGNSGGVLLNSDGCLIGVTAAIASPVQASAGVGFAIPSVIVSRVVPALIRTGHAEHPWLGIAGLSLQPEVARAMGLRPDQRGVLVIQVVPDSPADRAGLRASDREATVQGQRIPVGGDVIVAVDDQPVRTFEDLITYLARHTEVGQQITLTVLRDGRQVQVPVRLAARPRS